jgi:hypothetical protein
MPTSPVRADLLPDTATARRLRGVGAAPAATAPAATAPTCKPKRYVVADPDAPGAPTCAPRRYVTADPDAPNAPTCQPSRYIVAPDPSAAAPAFPEWATRFAAELADRARTDPLAPGRVR